MKKIKNFFLNLKTKFSNFFSKSKIMRRKNKSDYTKENNLKVKFSSSKLPRLYIHTKTPLTKALMFIVPVAIVAVGITFGVRSIKDKDTIKVNVELVDNDTNYRVFLISEDNIVVPVTLPAEERLDMSEVIIDVFNHLKDNKQYENNKIKGFIPSNTKLREIELKDGILTLDMTEEFLNIESKSALRALEAMTKSFLSLDGVEGLSVLIDGCLIDQIGNGVFVPLILDKNFGINRQIGSLNEAIGTEEVVMLYNKTINNQRFYVPVTVLAPKGTSKIETIYNAIDLEPSRVRGFSKVKEYNLVNRDSKPIISNNTVSIEVTKNAMVDEVTMSRELFELMSLTFDYTNLDYRVSLTFEGESYAVDGILDEDSYEVGSIIYNEVEL